MNDQILIPLKDLVTKEVSHDRLKYWVKLLEIRPQVTNHIALITPEESSQIKTLASMVSQGVSPKSAAKKIKGDLSTVTLPAKVNPSGEVTELKGLLLLFADEIKKSREENTALVGKIDRLSSEVASLRGFLLPAGGLAPKVSSLQVNREPTFGESFSRNMKEVQSWLQGVVAPFVEPFRGY